MLRAAPQHLAAVAALAVSALCGCSLRGRTVTRVADGLEVDSHAVSGEAYAAYARAAASEARGDDRSALAGYFEAISEDPDSAEVLARLGAVACRLSRAPEDDFARRADASFQRALALDAHSASAWLESGTCAELRGDTARALTAALASVEADASSVRATLLVSRLAERGGDLTRARTWLDALVVRSPASREAWAALAGFAERHRDRGRSIRAAQGLSALGIAPPWRRSLDAALAHGTLVNLRTAAIDARIGAGELAVRAARAGRLDDAAAQAELVLGANPDDADAWIAALATAHLTRKAESFRATLHAAPLTPTLPSPAAVELLVELLDAAVGADASTAFEAASAPRDVQPVSAPAH